MVANGVSQATSAHVFVGHYPLHLEYELRKYLLAGEKQQAFLSAERFLNQLESVSGERLIDLKSSVMQAVVVLYHKALQVGISVERSISRITFMARHIEKIETREEIRQFFRDVVSQILEKTSQHLAEEEFSYRVKSYIQAHFHKDVTLGDLAEAMRLDPAHLSRMFVRKIGLDFRDYLAQTRVQEARKLLSTTGLSVADVAIMVGYRDVAYFIRVFKRLVGITPGEFARRGNRPVSSRADSSAALGPAGAEVCTEAEIDQVSQENRAENAYPWIAEKNLSTAILSGDLQETRLATESFFAISIDQVKDIHTLKSYVIKLMVISTRKCLQNGVPVEDFLVGTLERCRRLDHLESYAQIHGFLDETTRTLCQRVVLQKNETIRAVEALKSYIQHNYSQPIKLEELAGMVHYSPCYLVRVFSRLTGYTPHEYLINTRIEAARELILRRKLTLEQVADSVGYQDTSHFVITFKKKFGQTPREYAERNGR